MSSFVSGGLINPAKRGLRSEALGHVADVYVTLCSLAKVSAVDEWALASGLPAVDGFDLSQVFLSSDPSTVSVSPRQMVPLAPLTGGDLGALEEYELLLAAWTAQQQLQRQTAGIDWDVYMNATCGNSGASKIKPDGHFVNMTLQGCEDKCAANAHCQMFEYANHAHWCGLHNATSFVRSDKLGNFDCGCKGPCPGTPSPGPPGPSPAPPNVPKCYVSKKCTIAKSIEPFVVKGKLARDDCCDACNELAVNATHGPSCAIATFVQDMESADDAGSCSLYSKEALAAKIDSSKNSKSVCLQPSVNNPPPEPVILGQAGIVVGDMKLVTGNAVTMAIFTGPTYPNASTPKDLIDGKVPSFACATPSKPWGCVFNVSKDPTEHDDLAAERPDVARSLLAMLRNVSRTYFDPDRGAVDPRACTRMIGINQGFFGPWLEMSVADGGSGSEPSSRAPMTEHDVAHSGTIEADYPYGDYRFESELGMEMARKERARVLAQEL